MQPVLGLSALSALSLLLGCPGGSTAQDSGLVEEEPPPIDSDLAAELETLLEQELSDLDGVGISAALQLPGRSLWRASVGLADLDAGRALETTDRFRVASITKTFTADLVLQLVEEGVLELDDLLVNHVDLLDSEGAADITVRHLLEHSAGVLDYTLTGDFQVAADQAWTDEELIALLAGEPLLAEPGSSWAYSNSHYVLLGMVVKAATGMSWDEQVRQRFLEPLGLDDTEIPTENWGEIVPCHINGTDYTDSIHPTAGSAAGGITSTSADLARWGEAFGSGENLGDEVFALQTENPWDLGSDFFYFGLGVLMMGDGLEDPELELGHNGALNGAAGWMGHRPGRGGTMVVLGNFWAYSSGSYDYQYPMSLSLRLWEAVEASEGR